MCDLTIFELSIRAFEIPSGWQDAYEKQREYTRRDLFMGKLNPDKFSQRLQYLNRYLDFIPIEKTSESLNTTKAYGKSFPEDEIRSIMGGAIPPELTVNLLSPGKEPWRFKDLYDQLNVYRQHWQADQQKQISAQMAGKGKNKSSQTKKKEKIVIEIITIRSAGAVVFKTSGKAGAQIPPPLGDNSSPWGDNAVCM
jgi:hypothetical protein